MTNKRQDAVKSEWLSWAENKSEWLCFSRPPQHRKKVAPVEQSCFACDAYFQALKDSRDIASNEIRAEVWEEAAKMAIEEGIQQGCMECVSTSKLAGAYRNRAKELRGEK